MIRNLKLLGLVLMFAFALSGLGASAASATTTDGELTSDGQVKLNGTDLSGGGFFGWLPTFFGESMECSGNSYDAEAVGGGLITPPATTFTVIMTPGSNCTATGPHKATVTTNGCDYVAHIKETTAVNDQYSLTVDTVCPAGKSVEVHVYLATNNENVAVCTVKVPPQTGLVGPTITTETAFDDLTFSGTLTGLKAEKEGLCGSGTTTEGVVHLNITFTGLNGSGTPTGITVSH